MDTQHVKDFYTYLQSQQTSQSFLYRCYQQLEGVNAEVKSFENTHAFINYLDHGLRFYETGKQLETLLQPLLLFYGMSHLLKAALLTVRPDYPESTAILAHGVSARKRKKRDYTFMADEVKLQNNGLYPYAAKYLFAVNEPPFTKVTMAQLLSLIPEMDSLWTFQRKQKLAAVGDAGGGQLQFPASLLDSYHITANALIKRIKPFVPAIERQETNRTSIAVTLDQPFQPAANSPFFTDSKCQKLYFPYHRENFLAIPEVLLHYLLLYNLSMLCRYEPEWWGDLLTDRPDQDYSFVKAFLNITSEKVPLMLGRILLQKHDSL
ncbi:YaaC family protein [Barrientosiimonas marina]|uniref:YaaC family protein n=1 Tax=Lentibacillus kimchii TaxID=1542911 RepID=A0ABW2UVB9_9BACI